METRPDRKPDPEAKPYADRYGYWEGSPVRPSVDAIELQYRLVAREPLRPTLWVLRCRLEYFHTDAGFWVYSPVAHFPAIFGRWANSPGKATLLSWECSIRPCLRRLLRFSRHSRRQWTRGGEKRGGPGPSPTTQPEWTPQYNVPTAWPSGEMREPLSPEGYANTAFNPYIGSSGANAAYTSQSMFPNAVKGFHLNSISQAF